MRDLSFFLGGGGFFRGRGGLCRCRLCVYIYLQYFGANERGRGISYPPAISHLFSSLFFFFLSRVFDTISVLGAAFCEPP